MLTSAVAAALLASPPAAGELLEEIIGDHTLPHVAKPRGVPDSTGWNIVPRVGMGNIPQKGWTAFIAWGQVYEPPEGSTSTNTRVEIRNIQAYFLSKKTQRWRRVQFSNDVAGAYYVEDFTNDANKPGDQRPVTGGGTSIKTSVGYNYHFWVPGDRYKIDDVDDIAGIYTAVQARLARENPDMPDDRDKAKFMMSMGADFWEKPDSQWDQWKTNGDAMIGRFRWIGKNWGWHHATTIGAEELRKNPPPAPTTQP